MKPLVSVAVITYNMEKYLSTLLDSILKQKVNFSYEIVIDDDHSPDHSREIIEDYQRQFPEVIKPIYRERNIGGSRNMFGVLNTCRGKYIAILEGDDFWEADDKLLFQVNFLESHPEYIGMTCNSWCEHDEKPTFSSLMRNRTEPKVFTLDDFKRRHFRDRLPSSTDTWVFRNIFKEYPHEDFSLFYVAHNMIWDQSLILLLYSKGKIYADPRVVSHHRSVVKKDGTNFQSLIAKNNLLYSDSLMYQRMENYIVNQLHENCGDFRLARADVWIDAVFRWIRTGKMTDLAVSQKIWKDQDNKKLLMRLLVEKFADVGGRKIRKMIQRFR